VRRIVVVPSGNSEFAMTQESSKDGERVLDEVLRWIPYKEFLVPLAKAVYWGVTWLIESERTSRTVPKDVTPGIVVTAAFTQTLRLTGPFQQVVAMASEPVGDARRETDAIVRLTVPLWGLVRVRNGQPALVSGFADVRAQLVLRETGVVLWEHAEDVTHPERLAADAVSKDRALVREGLVEVLERAGRRLANELLYARGGGP
jgi:hypothetical protein